MPLLTRRQKSILFWVFLGLFVLSGALTIWGLTVTWQDPEKDLPYLKELFTTTILETVVAVVLLFRMVFTQPRAVAEHHPSSLVEGSVDVIQCVRDSFMLFSQSMAACLQKGAKFRLHLLAYHADEDHLTMRLQDYPYADSNFEIAVSEGVRKGVVACEALRRGGLVARDLGEDHKTHYKGSVIPEKLSAVIAFPIKNSLEEFIGVVALDSRLPLGELPIDEDSLKELFMVLCQTVQDVLKSAKVSQL